MSSALVEQVAPLSVRQMIAHMASEHDDPATLAAAVVEALGNRPKRLRAALVEVLPSYVSAYIGRQRNIVIEARGASQVQSARSAKSASIRDWYSRFLAQPLRVKDGYRRIGDCDRADLLFAASERYGVAERNMSRARQYERLAELVGDGTVADLDEAVVRSALDGLQ